MLDFLEMIRQGYDMDTFEVVQYAQLAVEVEHHINMGSDFDDALSLAYETAVIV